MALQAKSVFLALALTTAAFGGSLARADEVVTPPDGKAWGESNSAESLLKMNRDPEIVRKVDPDHAPIVMKGNCTDEQGNTYTGDDEDYSLCMNKKSAHAKTAATLTTTSTTPATTAPASVKKQN
jgi:hypothetical protein